MWVLRPQSEQTACGLGTNPPPQKGAFEGNAHQRYCPLWVAVFEICSDCMSLLPWKARLYHYNSCVVVVHSCLQLRLIRHEWGASFFDVGASFKNYSCRLKEQSRSGLLALERTNCLRVGKIFPHNLYLHGYYSYNLILHSFTRTWYGYFWSWLGKL